MLLLVEHAVNLTGGYLVFPSYISGSYFNVVVLLIYPCFLQ